MTTQTEAQLLADALDDGFAQGRISNYAGRKAATELRRLEAANAELLESLVEVLDYADCERSSPFWDHFDRVRNKASATIKKHGGGA